MIGKKKLVHVCFIISIFYVRKWAEQLDSAREYEVFFKKIEKLTSDD